MQLSFVMYSVIIELNKIAIGESVLYYLLSLLQAGVIFVVSVVRITGTDLRSAAR